MHKGLMMFNVKESNFWWGHGSEKNKLSHVESNTLHLPKWQSELEIWKAALMNEAPPAKQYWRFITDPSLLMPIVMKAKYFPNNEHIERSNHKWLLDLETIVLGYSLPTFCELLQI